MVKIYLSPSNQSANRYCVGNTTEKVQMERLATALKAALEQRYTCEVTIATLSLGIGQSGRPKEAKDLDCDVYLALHSNAGGGGTASGAVAFYHPDSKTGKALATAIVKELGTICPVKSNRSAPAANGMLAFDGAGYGEVRTPTQYGLVSVLAETDFHDNPSTAQWIIDHTEEIAAAYARALAQVLNLPQKADQKKLLYKVQVGAYSSKANADAMLNRLKALGVNGYIRCEEASN